MDGISFQLSAKYDNRYVFYLDNTSSEVVEFERHIFPFKFVQSTKKGEIPVQVEAEFAESDDSPITEKSKTSTVTTRLLDYISNYHNDSVNAVTRVSSSTEEVIADRTSVSPGRASPGTNKNKKQKNKKTSSQSTQAVLFSLSGQHILYDKRTWNFKKENISYALRYGQLWFSTTNLLSSRIRDLIWPFGIYVRSLRNFPIGNLKTDPMKVKLKYTLGDLLKDVEVPALSYDNVNNCIIFEDVRFMILQNVPLAKILLNLQSEKLVVEIIEPDVKTIPELMLPAEINYETLSDRVIHKPVKVQEVRANKKPSPGTETAKKHATKSGNAPPGPNKRLLGYAVFDFSALSEDQGRLASVASVSQFIKCKQVQGKNITTYFNALSIHEDMDDMKVGKVPEGEFVSKRTDLKIEAQLTGLPQVCSTLRENLNNCLYKRIVAIVHKAIQIQPVLWKVNQMNSQNVDRKMIGPWAPYWTFTKVPKMFNDNPCLLTGFFVESSNICILYLETLGDAVFTDCVTELLNLSSRYGRVLYNSELLFGERIYREFMPFGGVYFIKTNGPLDSAITNWIGFLRGTVPQPAMRAFNNLSRLTTCPTIEVACRESLFPTTQELMSFDQEYGKPSYTGHWYLH